MKQALQPGIKVATDGFKVDPTFFNQVDAVKTYFDDVPSTEKIYLDPDGSPKDVGSTITNPDMAKTYGIIGSKGAKKGFYRGDVAAATAEAAAHPPIADDADHRWRDGLMTQRDIKDYRAIDRKPVVSSYRGLDVYGMGPPSSGGSTVAEVLNILQGYEPAGSSKTEIYHRLLEASRYAFADRNAYLADPAFFDVPLAGLVSMSFAAERRALIRPNAATSPVAARRSLRQPEGRRQAQGQGDGDHLAPAPVDDAPHGRRQEGDDGLLHVHDRVHGRQRRRGPGIRVPAQQRADGLQLRVHDGRQQGRGRQAPAQLDGADDHREGRRAVHGRRLAGRLDDPGHGPADRS